MSCDEDILKTLATNEMAVNANYVRAEHNRTVIEAILFVRIYSSSSTVCPVTQVDVANVTAFGRMVPYTNAETLQI